MSVGPYQVVFTGITREGISRREGIRLLAENFGLGFRQINNLLAGKRRVIRRCESEPECEKLIRAFWKAGWYAEFTPEARSGNKVSSGDGSCSVVLPNKWQQLFDLNKAAVFQAGKLDENQFLVILNQKKNDLRQGLRVSEYCSAQLKQCSEQVMCGAMCDTAKSFTKGAYPGSVGEVEAKIESIPVQYLMICLECENSIYTLIFWSESKDYQEQKPIFVDIASSFQEYQAPIEIGRDKHEFSSPGLTAII